MKALKTSEIEARLARATPDSPEAIELKTRLSWRVWSVDLVRAQRLSEEARSSAERVGDERGIAFAKGAQGLFLWGTGDAERAVALLTDALTWFEAHGDRAGIAHAKVGLAYAHWGFGDFKRGFELAEESLAAAEGLGDAEAAAWALSALGGFYLDWKDHERALDHWRRALDTFVEFESLSGQARALNGIGNAYHLLGDNAQALEYQNRSLATFESIGSHVGAAKTLNDIGLILQSEERYDEALDYHRRALAVRVEHDYVQGECTCLLDIAHVHIVQRRYDEARETLDRALLAAEKIRSKTKQRRAHELFSRLYRDLGEFDIAFVHFENYHRLTEEVFHEDSQQKLRNMRSALEQEAAAREAEIQRKMNDELREKNERLQRTLAELRNTQAQILQDGKMAALGGLVAGLAHEINTPVGTIKSAADISRRALERIRESLESGEDPEGALEQVRGLTDVLQLNANNTAVGAERIERMVRSLRTFAHLDQAGFQRTDIHEGIESALTLLGPEVPRGVTVERDYGELSPIFAYPGDLNQVFMNIIVNALQAFGGAGGRVTVRTRAAGGRVRVEISDDGRGIPEDKLAHLFEPGFTRKHATVRMRTGLYTSHNIVRNHLGELTVESRVGKGTMFRISIPDNLDQLISEAAGRA
ncbi:MAG: tetratricopeptide repeat protein [Candidatus Krumholzibacteria bacterium]|nr:tetratricopeptide repeat protein [Candidatus Krumholzibacteria bacterium]